jgi:hypothetical protein
MKKEIFVIETADGTAEYQGISLGQLWNGWECPLFELKTALKVLKDFHSYCSEENKHDYDFSFFQYDPLYDVIIETYFMDAKINFVATHKPIVINNKKYYDIGGFNWTWWKKNNY